MRIGRGVDLLLGRTCGMEQQQNEYEQSCHKNYLVPLILHQVARYIAGAIDGRLRYREQSFLRV